MATNVVIFENYVEFHPFHGFAWIFLQKRIAGEKTFLQVFCKKILELSSKFSVTFPVLPKYGNKIWMSDFWPYFHKKKYFFRDEKHTRTTYNTVLIHDYLFTLIYRAISQWLHL